MQLLADQRFRFAELTPMRSQLEGDIRAFLDSPDRDPESERIWERVSAQGNLDRESLLFLTWFRAVENSDDNKAFFRYAADRLGTIIGEVSALSMSNPDRDTLLNGNKIAALERVPERSESHFGVNQPEIHLSADAKAVDVVDMSDAGTSYLYGIGFRASVARAAELLAASAVGSTRADVIDGRGGWQNTPASAVWMNSLRFSTEILASQRKAVIPFEDGALLAQPEPEQADSTLPRNR